MGWKIAFYCPEHFLDNSFKTARLISMKLYTNNKWTLKFCTVLLFIWNFNFWFEKIAFLPQTYLGQLLQNRKADFNETLHRGGETLLFEKIKSSCPHVKHLFWNKTFQRYRSWNLYRWVDELNMSIYWFLPTSQICH